MKVTIRKHFDYGTPFSEADNDDELAKIMRLKYPQACSGLETKAEFFAGMVEQVKQYQAWRVIGFKSFEDFCREELGKTLDEVETIVTGVKLLQAGGRAGSVTREDAVSAAASKTTGEVLPQGRPVKRDDSSRLNDRAKVAGVSRQTQHRLDRLPADLRARVAAGEMSCHAAAIAAGIVRVKTPLEHVRYWWRKMSEQEQSEFIEANRTEEGAR